MKKNLIILLIIGYLSILVFPWYAIEYGFWSFEWLFEDGYISPEGAPAIFQILLYGKWQLIITMLLLIYLTIFIYYLFDDNLKFFRHLVFVSLAGMVLMAVQGLLIGQNGVNLGIFEVSGQEGMGYGALILFGVFLFLFTCGLSRSTNNKADAFIVGSIGLIVTLITIFIFFPISHILIKAFKDNDNNYDIIFFLKRIFTNDIWGMQCFVGIGDCGVAWNSFLLGIATASGTVLLGLSFALVATRTGFQAKKSLRVITIIPIITPPFVIGLALILLFGRSGLITEWAHLLFGIEKTRWLYGFFGVWLAQMLSFTPIAFLVLIGVVEGVSPSMEEAAQTLRANHWQVFNSVTFPLMRPGLANAFLLGFIESLADFGNPLVLGGGYDVLSTEIYFSIVGAQGDGNRAAILALVLLFFTVSAFILQRKWLGKKSYATVTGKADSGQHSLLNPLLRNVCFLTALPWAFFTVVIYGMILFGGFVKLWGYDHSFTLMHYADAFSIEWGDNGLWWKGAAWNSYFTTLEISLIAAPLTAIVGLLTAYLLVRKQFFGKNIFEFGTMLSFAIPGTVIGVSYILAFNVPPIEITGTGIILIVCFIFRNMPVGVRGGIAAMKQLDASLDEASITLGANSFTTIKRVIVPLMGPAILAALIYSFVRSITSVSAVIFLVSADHNMATSYIIGLVENGEFGIAIAYCSVLIVTMLAVILSFQFIVGQRKLRRENRLQRKLTNKNIATA